MTDLVLLERAGAIAKVTLNQPAKLNAVNNAMWRRLRELFAELDADDGLRCVVLAGAGERAFSVGADISEFEESRSTIEQARRYARAHARRDARDRACRHPVIAQIRGLCVGGGLELTTVCDLRICGASARFGIPVKRLGLVVSYTELKPLLELIGPANALEILLEGRIYGAEEALRMGLVNRVVPDAEVEREVDGDARAHRRGRAAGRALAQEVHQPPAAARRRSATRRWTRASTATTPRTSGPAIRRFWPRPSRNSGAAERPGALGAIKMTTKAGRSGMSVDRRVAEHYARGDVRAAISAALQATGKDVGRLSLDDLAPIDEFHLRGRAATAELTGASGLTSGMRVLDVGSGIGGPSRYVAATYGCDVVGIDLTEEYCRVAALLADRVGLGERVEYRPGNALAMPFADGAFDAAYTQHVAMNIEDKARLYAEICAGAEARRPLWHLRRAPGRGRRGALPGAVGARSHDELSRAPGRAARACSRPPASRS